MKCCAAHRLQKIANRGEKDHSPISFRFISNLTCIIFPNCLKDYAIQRLSIMKIGPNYDSSGSSCGQLIFNFLRADMRKPISLILTILLILVLVICPYLTIFNSINMDTIDNLDNLANLNNFGNVPIFDHLQFH